jgi:hypothetical protein
MTLNRLDTIKKILDDQNNLGARADSKATAFLTTLGLFTAFFIFVVQDAPANIFSEIVIFIYLISTILALYNIIMTIYPRSRVTKDETRKSGPNPYDATFYGNICRLKSVGDYKDCLEELLKDEKTIEDVYARQIYDVAVLTSAKYKYAQRSVYFVVLAISSEFCLIAYMFAHRFIG